MKKVLLALVLASFASFASSALADRDDYRGGYHGGGHYENHYYHGGGGSDWLAPLIVGGVAGYVLAQPPRTVVVQQPPVVYQQPQVIYQQALPPAPIGYHYANIVDAACNCYKTVLLLN